MQDLNDIFSNEQGPSYLVRTGVAVAGDSARMQSVGAQFRDFGLEVIQPSLEELATGAHSLQGEAVALLAMDASSSGGISGAAEVLRQIRQHHPHLPALWVGAGQEAAPEGFEFVVHDGDELSHLDGPGLGRPLPTGLRRLAGGRGLGLGDRHLAPELFAGGLVGRRAAAGQSVEPLGGDRPGAVPRVRAPPGG
jgi:hypothetical protein